MNERKLRCCPSAFYTSCANAISKCTSCAAGYGRETAKVLYTPRLKYRGMMTEHPYLKVQRENKAAASMKSAKSKERSVQVRKAYKEERRIVQQIARQTLKSGALFGDGDFHSLDFIQADHKERFNSKSFTLSRSEYDKGIRQGTNQWVITSDLAGDKQSVVTMTMDAYTRLLAYAQKGLEALNRERKDCGREESI